MNKNIPILLCGCAILLTLFLRSRVYENIVPYGQSNDKVLQEKRTDIPITIHYHEKRPYYFNSKSEVHGLVADRISLIFHNAGIDFNWINTPAKRQLEIIKKNETMACAAGWFKTPEREMYGRYTLPIYQDRPFVAITRADNSMLYYNDSLTRIFKEERLLLLVKDGYSYGGYIDELIKKSDPWRTVTTANNKSMLQMILTRRADFCLMTEEEAQDLLLLSGLHKADFKVIELNDVPAGSLRYLICSQQFKNSYIEELNSVIRHFLKIPEPEM